MADTSREVTEEQVDAIADKLGPAFESLTEDEREVFALVMAQTDAEGPEVAGFAQGLSLGMETLGSLSYAGSSVAGGAGGATQAAALSWFRNCSRRVDCCSQPGGGSRGC